MTLSVGGVMFRTVQEASDWQVLFYRAVGFAAGALLFVLVNRRGRLVAAFRGIGRAGIVASVILGVAVPCYVLAILNATVANALFLVSTSPLFAAVVGLITLRERVKAITWLAAGIALLGIGVMTYGNFYKAGGVELDGRLLFGNVMAILAALGLGSYAVALRFRTDADMSPVLIPAGILSAIIAIVATGGDVVVVRFDLVLCLVMGLQTVLGFALLTFGAKYIPAAEVALLSLMEVLFGPVWVELFIGETVESHILIGGPIVLAAVLGYSLYAVVEARHRRRARLSAPGWPSGRRMSLREPPLHVARAEGEPAPAAARGDIGGALAYALRRAERAEAEATGVGLRPPEPAGRRSARAQAPARPRRPAAPPPDPFAEAARLLTVEYRLRERLEPVLRQWVDRNLPRIAEGMVRAELHRLIDRAKDARDETV